MLIFSSLYLPLCLSSLGCNSLPCVLTLCMQELLFFQFVQGLLVGKMEWWLPNSLHGKLEIGSPPLTFQSFLRVIVARCIDRFFFLYFSILKISLFVMRSQWSNILFFFSVLFFSRFFEDFPLRFDFYVVWYNVPIYFAWGSLSSLNLYLYVSLYWEIFQALFFKYFSCLFCFLPSGTPTTYMLELWYYLADHWGSINLFLPFPLCISGWIISINLCSS